jgi:hypothetical protein
MTTVQKFEVRRQLCTEMIIKLNNQVTDEEF